MRIVLLCILVLLLAGCSKAQLLGQGVNHICGLSPEKREVLRFGADKVADPHQIRILCVDESVPEEFNNATLE